MFRVDIDSKEAEAAIREMDAAVRAVGALGLDAGSNLPYAFGIETGRRRDGRLARRKGGAHMVERGIAQAGPQLESMVADGIPYGVQGVNNAVRRWGRLVARPAIQALTPVVTGALRDSITVVPR
jgi:hypothetical protein